MSDNEQNSSSKNEINQNELYYDLQSKEDNKVLKSIVKGYKKIENTNICYTDTGDSTSLNKSESDKIIIGDVKNHKTISKKTKKKKTEKEKEKNGKKLEEEPENIKDINNDSLDDSMKNNIFSCVRVNNPKGKKIYLNDLKENEIKNTNHNSKITKKDDFSKDIKIIIPKNLFDSSLDILNKNEIIYIIKKILSCCLSNFFSSLKYRARREFGLDLRYICSKKVKN